MTPERISARSLALPAADPAGADGRGFNVDGECGADCFDAGYPDRHGLPAGAPAVLNDGCFGAARRGFEPERAVPELLCKRSLGLGDRAH